MGLIPWPPEGYISINGIHILPRTWHSKCCPCLGSNASSTTTLLGGEFVKAIGNVVGELIERSEPKDNIQACEKICVKLELGKGLHEEFILKVDN